MKHAAVFIAVVLALFESSAVAYVPREFNLPASLSVRRARIFSWPNSPIVWPAYFNAKNLYSLIHQPCHRTETKQTVKAPTKAAFDVKHAAATIFTAATLASNVFLCAAPAQADVALAPFSSSTIVAEKITRSGMYQDYTVDIEQSVDDSRSTFKGAKETKSKKGEWSQKIVTFAQYEVFLLMLVTT